MDQTPLGRYRLMGLLGLSGQGMREMRRASAGGLALVARIAAGCGSPAPNHQSSQPSTSSSPTASSAPSHPAQTVLPFNGLKEPTHVAVDSSGAVYVTDWGNKRVLKLATGSSTASVLPFIGLKGPHGVAVDSNGNVYVADPGNNQVVKLTAG